MSLFIELDKKNIDKLSSYIDEYRNEGEKDISGIWEKFSKNSKFKIKNNKIIFNKNIFTNQGRIAFDRNFLQNHGIKERLSISKRITKLKNKIKSSLKILIYNDLYRQLTAFSNIWDNQENVLTTSVIKNQNKILSWDIIKSYNYFNEIYPIINQMKNPQYYFEIGAGGCHLPSIIKNNFNKKLKFILIDLKSSIPFGFINLSKKFPDAKILLPNEIKTKEELLSLDYDFLFLTNEQLDLIPENFVDIAVNTNSFMEMLPNTISNYFKILRKSVKEKNLFYCYNRVEKKMWKKGINIKKSEKLILNNPDLKENHILIKFTEYPWSKYDNDYFFYVPKFSEVRFKHSFFSRATILSKK